MDDKLAAKLLRSISLDGNTQDDTNTIISHNPMHIINHANGYPRINNPEKFSLILSLPETLSSLNPFEIRCCMCRKVISYPAWYYSVKYAVNNFHFFVCFDSSSPEKVTCACLRS